MNDVLRKCFSTESKKTKEVSTGGDFQKLYKSGIFVDKTLLIKEIIEDGSEAILLTMPRRWGKSINLDMLKRFLSNEEQYPEQK